jgi:predicted dehydrogenase
MSAAVSRSASGANDRIHVGVIGTGVRGEHLTGIFAENADCEVAAVFDVYKPHRDKVAAKAKPGADTYVDYRKILDRKDLDAVVIATPDHWHGPMLIQACDAGKDVYCEKPLTNDIAVGLKMIEAVKRNNRIAQIGVQQRHWDQFVQCADIVKSGKIGKVTHAGLHWEGHYTRPAEQAQEPPADLDWNLFQGPAERLAYTPGRHRSWRSYYDYAGGILTDQGVHVADVARWYLDAGAPLSAAGLGQDVVVACPAKDQLPDTFIVTWQYPGFVMSFMNRSMPNPDYRDQGTYFVGTEGALHVNRYGFNVRPNEPRRGRDGKPLPPSFEAVAESRPWLGVQADRAHVREFLDCIKSRQKPVGDVETGFLSTLPLLLGVLSIRYGRTYTWDGREARPS